MLLSDNGTGELKEEDPEGVVIPFPGVKSAEEEFAGIRERGTIHGEVICVGGPNKWVPVLIQTAQGVLPFETTKPDVIDEVARQAESKPEPEIPDDDAPAA
jgi:hypothetical protein